MRKYGNNAVEHFTVGAVQRFRQPAEESDLRRVQRPAVKVEPLCHSDPAVIAPHRFEGIGAGQHHNVPANRAGADVKFM